MTVKNTLLQIFSGIGSKDAKKGEQITAQKASEEVRNNEAVLVDVREESEIKKGMASSALWLATSEIENQTQNYHTFISQLPKDKKIIIYCGAGVRAGRFIEKLETLGFKTANMGGFSDWQFAGLPIKK